MPGRQKLGDLIRSIDFTKVKDGASGPDHPITKLDDLKDKCQDDITFEELKDAYKAFEKKVCVKDFPEADKPGCDVACKTMEMLTEVLESFLEKNRGSSKPLKVVRLHLLMSLLQAGPNSTHVSLMYYLTEESSGLESYIRRLEDKDELVQLLKALKITLKYPKNRGMDEDMYSSTLRERLVEIFNMIGLDQYDMVHKEFLDVYQHYLAQMPALSETFAREVLRLVRDMVERFADENPYLELKDTDCFKKHLTVLQEMVCSKGYKYDGPSDDAAKAVVERIMKAVIEEDLVTEVYDHIMDVLVKIWKHEHGRKEGGDIINKVRLYLIREIADRQLPVKPLFKSSLNMILAMLEREVTDAVQLLANDIINIFIEEADPSPSSDAEVLQILLFIRGIVMSGRRDLLIYIKGMLNVLLEQEVLEWENYVEQAKRILEAIGEVTIKSIRDDGCLDRTVMEYRDFSEDYLAILSKSEIMPAIQLSLAKMFLTCMQDDTLIKVRYAAASVRTEWMNLSKEKTIRLELLKKCECMLKNSSLDWKNPYLIEFMGNMVNVLANSYEGNGKNVGAEENKLFVSIFNTAGEGGKSVIKHWYQPGHAERSNVKMNIWRMALKSYVELHQKSATLVCIEPVIPNIIRWAKIAVKEKHEDMTRCTIDILTNIGKTPPPEFKSYIADVLDLVLMSKHCQDLYHFVKELYPHNPEAIHQKLKDIFTSLERFTTKEINNIPWILHTVSEHHPEVFTKSHIGSIFDRAKKGGTQEHTLIVMVIKNISDKCPKILVDFFPSLCDGSIFKEDTLNVRCDVIATLAGVNEKLGPQAVEYLMKYALFSGPPIGQIALAAVGSMAQIHPDHVKPYKSKLEKLKKTSKIPEVKETVHDVLLILDGKTS